MGTLRGGKTGCGEVGEMWNGYVKRSRSGMWRKRGEEGRRRRRKRRRRRRRRRRREGWYVEGLVRRAEEVVN